MEIKNAQKEVDNWINKHGVRYFNELTNMALLSEEVGEVGEDVESIDGTKERHIQKQSPYAKDPYREPIE